MASRSMIGSPAYGTPRSANRDALGKRLHIRRMQLVLAILFFALLIIVSRLIELQIIKGDEYAAQASAQHYGGIILPAKRGEILSRNSKTGEKNILATNTTLDLLYVDPFVTRDKTAIAGLLARTILGEEQHQLCSQGSDLCHREFRSYYQNAFEPDEFQTVETVSPSAEPSTIDPAPVVIAKILPSLEEAQSELRGDILRRISEEYISFVPLLYGATKQQLKTIHEYNIPGISASDEQKMVFGNPLYIPEYERRRIATILSPVLSVDTDFLEDRLKKRRLRYVPILRRISPELSKEIKKLKVQSAQDAAKERSTLRERKNFDEANAVEDALRGIALIPEHWRFYPDGSIAPQVVGFVNLLQQPQNGIEKYFDRDLKGMEGRISTLTDPFGGQIMSNEQSVVQAEDGKTIVLTIDRYLQRKVEEILSAAVEEFKADSGQVIIMDPQTGRVIALANAPNFDANNYSAVYEKEYIDIPDDKVPTIVVELYHPQTNSLVVRSYINDLKEENRSHLSRELQVKLHELELLYDLDDLKRYYLYLGESIRREIFPSPDGRWLKYKNELGVGAYINKAVQEIYEPGSVFKPITMSIAIDQNELVPEDTYDDTGVVEIDEYEIDNAEGNHFGLISMTECLSFSVNTCMTSVSQKLGKKLFHSYIDRFGFGRISGIELENEKSGQILDWRRWSDALLATASYGQGISATPMQVVTAFGVLANGGRLMRPTIIDSWINPDGTEEINKPKFVEQVITEETAATITAMLTHGGSIGYAKSAKVDGYKLAGKTGTSQIAGPGGKYEKAGTGSTITTLAGYAPVANPKFVMLVKLDRPQKDEYGSRSAAPIFKNIAALLFEYYGIPPDDI